MASGESVGLRLIRDDGSFDFTRFTKIQMDYIFCDNFMPVQIGGMFSGKTAALCAACWMSAMIPNNRGWICRQTNDKLQDSTMREFFAQIGTTAKEARSHPVVKFWNQKDRLLYLVNGTEIKFVSLEAEAEAKGGNLGFIGLDQVEETTPLAFDSLDSRCRLPTIPDHLLRFYVIGNPAPGWTHRTFYLRKGSYRDFQFFGSKTQDLTHVVGDNYLKRQLANKPEWWINRNVYGNWGGRDGGVFFKFNPERNTISRKEFDKISSSDLPVLAGYDHGSNNSHPCAIIYLTWDMKDKFYLFSGKKANLNVPEFAKEIRRMEAEFSNKIMARVADLDTFGQRGIGTPAEAYRTEGIDFQRCNKKPNYLSEAISRVNALFSCENLMIVDDMTEVIDEISGWEYVAKRGDILATAPADINDDFCKAIIYATLEIHTEAERDERKYGSYKEVTDQDVRNFYLEEGLDPVTGY